MVFGAGGVWARILYKADGYLGTEMWCEDPAVRQYRVRDCWEWHRNFEIFRSRSQMEFEQFESWILSSGLIEKEKFLGAYYERRNDGEQDSVLI